MTEWTGIAEQLATLFHLRHFRVVGFTSPDSNSGVSSLASVIAATLANTKKVLLVETCANRSKTCGNNRMQSLVPFRGSIEPDIRGFDTLKPRMAGADEFIFGNAAEFQQAFDRNLAEYNFVLLDLPPVLEAGPETLNAIPAAAICDAIYIVCVTGRTTRQQVAEVRRSFDLAGVRLSGAVLNDLNYNTPNEEMAACAHRVLRIAPIFDRWLRSKLLGSNLAQSQQSTTDDIGRQS